MEKYQPMKLCEGQPFDDPNYIFELKFDGFRAIAYVDGARTTLVNRIGNDFTDRFPTLRKLHDLVNGRAVLDGEIIALTAGKPDFRKLLGRGYPVQFVAFDVLNLDGRDLCRLPLMERKKILEKIVTESAILVISKYLTEHGKDLFALSRQQNLEGIVAKQKNSIYMPGKRSPAWLKIKANDWIETRKLKQEVNQV